MKGISRTKAILGCLGALVLLWGCAATQEKPADRNVDVTVTCPVSGGQVSTARSAHVVEYEGKKYHLCCTSCKEDFEKNPEKYLVR
jgi:YHS domain-containing protein